MSETPEPTDGTTIFAPPSPMSQDAPPGIRPDIFPCAVCGCLVFSVTAHTAFHERVDPLPSLVDQTEVPLL